MCFKKIGQAVLSGIENEKNDRQHNKKKTTMLIKRFFLRGYPPIFLLHFPRKNNQPQNNLRQSKRQTEETDSYKYRSGVITLFEGKVVAASVTWGGDYLRGLFIQ